MSVPVLLRQVPGDTVIHRLWAGTKLMCVAVIGLTLSLVPSWPMLGVGVALLLLPTRLARVPRGVVPRLPWWFWLVLLLGAALSLPAGLGAVLVYLRLTALGAVLLWASLMVGWTTPLGEIAPALARLGTPLRWVRVPVDEWAVTVALCLRSVPLLAEDLAVLYAARRLRPSRRQTSTPLFEEVVDVLTAAMAVSSRRAGELGVAITARGGTGQLTAHPARPGRADAVALGVVIAVCLGSVLLL
jgi:energy-coupling factor transport system permease protein